MEKVSPSGLGSSVYSRTSEQDQSKKQRGKSLRISHRGFLLGRSVPRKLQGQYTCCDYEKQEYLGEGKVNSLLRQIYLDRSGNHRWRAPSTNAAMAGLPEFRIGTFVKAILAA